MRLIDADEFKKHEVLEKLRTAEFDDEIKDVIKSISTAYDLDKVVERLGKIKTDNSCKDCAYKEKCDELQECYNPSDEIDLCALVAKELSIEIVKSGGITKG